MLRGRKFHRMKDGAPRRQVAFDSDARIPILLKKTLQHLESHCLDVPEILTKAASAIEVEKLKRKFDIGQLDEFGATDPHVIAGLLKFLLVELDKPVVDASYVERLASDVDLESGDITAVLPLWEKVMPSLTDFSRDLLRDIVAFAKQLAESPNNNVLAADIAHVLGPLLMRPRIASIAEDSHLAAKLLEAAVVGQISYDVAPRSQLPPHDASSTTAGTAGRGAGAASTSQNGGGHSRVKGKDAGDSRSVGGRRSSLADALRRDTFWRPVAVGLVFTLLALIILFVVYAWTVHQEDVDQITADHKLKNVVLNSLTVGSTSTSTSSVEIDDGDDNSLVFSNSHEGLSLTSSISDDWGFQVDRDGRWTINCDPSKRHCKEMKDDDHSVFIKGPVVLRKKGAGVIFPDGTLMQSSAPQSGGATEAEIHMEAAKYGRGVFSLMQGGRVRAEMRPDGVLEVKGKTLSVGYDGDLDDFGVESSKGDIRLEPATGLVRSSRIVFASAYGEGIGFSVSSNDIVASDNIHIRPQSHSLELSSDGDSEMDGVVSLVHKHNSVGTGHTFTLNGQDSIKGGGGNVHVFGGTCQLVGDSRDVSEGEHGQGEIDDPCVGGDLVFDGGESASQSKRGGVFIGTGDTGAIRIGGFTNSTQTLVHGDLRLPRTASAPAAPTGGGTGRRLSGGGTGRRLSGGSDGNADGGDAELDASKSPASPGGDLDTVEETYLESARVGFGGLLTPLFHDQSALAGHVTAGLMSKERQHMVGKKTFTNATVTSFDPSSGKADAIRGGIMTNGLQGFAGDKSFRKGAVTIHTFSDKTALASATSNGLMGTEDQELIGHKAFVSLVSMPMFTNATAAASETEPGLMKASGSQTLGGAKTLLSNTHLSHAWVMGALELGSTSKPFLATRPTAGVNDTSTPTSVVGQTGTVLGGDLVLDAGDGGRWGCGVVRLSPRGGRILVGNAEVGAGVSVLSSVLTLDTGDATIRGDFVTAQAMFPRFEGGEALGAGSDAVGLVTTGEQTFAGSKTFQKVTVTDFATHASSFAKADVPGVVHHSYEQTIAGDKTFAGAVFTTFGVANTSPTTSTDGSDAADVVYPSLMSNTTQTVKGDKTFTASTHFIRFDSGKAAGGEAGSEHMGLVSTGPQSFSGEKTLVDGLRVSGGGSGVEGAVTERVDLAHSSVAAVGDTSASLSIGDYSFTTTMSLSVQGDGSKCSFTIGSGLLQDNHGGDGVDGALAVGALSVSVLPSTSKHLSIGAGSGHVDGSDASLQWYGGTVEASLSVLASPEVVGPNLVVMGATTYDDPLIVPKVSSSVSLRSAAGASRAPSGVLVVDQTVGNDTLVTGAMSGGDGDDDGVCLVSSLQLTNVTANAPCDGRGLYVSKDGRVGVGASAQTVRNSGVAMYVSGNGFVTGKIHAQSIVQTSDQRLKSNIRSLGHVGGRLEGVRGVTYQWKASAEREGEGEVEREIGLLAQDLIPHFPELTDRTNLPLKRRSETGPDSEELDTGVDGEGEGEGVVGVDYGRVNVLVLAVVQEVADVLGAVGRWVRCNSDTSAECELVDSDGSVTNMQAALGESVGQKGEELETSLSDVEVLVKKLDALEQSITSSVDQVDALLSATAVSSWSLPSWWATSWGLVVALCLVVLYRQQDEQGKRK